MIAIAAPGFDQETAWRYLAQRALPGIDAVTETTWTRTYRHAGAAGVATIAWDPVREVLTIAADPGEEAVAERVRRVLGLDVELADVHRELARDPFMAGLIAVRPSVRVMGAWDPFEATCRAILGQQVTIAQARSLAARLVERGGASFAGGALFPTPEEVIAADLTAMGMPGARAEAIRAVAAASLEDPGLFRPGAELIGRLRAIRGIGEWTAQYVAMRAARDPDAFPASDVGLLRGAAVDGVRPTPKALLARAEAWRPWRAWAAQHLWAADQARGKS